MNPSSPLDYAKLGDVEYFKTVELHVLQNFKSENGDGILALTAYIGQLDCCKEIYQRCPEQLFCQNMHGNSILHHVARHRGGMLSMLEFLLGVAVKAKEDIESGLREDNIQFKEWCKLQNQDGETALLRTIQVHNLEAVQLWLKVDNDHKLQLLSVANYEGNTPLHLAVEHQDLQMVKLLVRDKLDIEYGANRNGKTPLSLAMQKAQSSGAFVNDTSVGIRQLILESQPNQTKVPTEYKKWTLLHYATYNGDLGLVQGIIRFCPDCMNMVDSEGQNFLHIAAKFERIEVVKNILRAKEIIPLGVLNCKDNNGNTPLHIAALTGNEPITLCFLYDSRVTKLTPNNNGQLALEVINFPYDKKRARVPRISARDRMNDKDIMDQSNVGLVVGTLIATVSFTAGITVPGGYINEGQNQGMAMLSKSSFFEAFVISNNFALIFSLCAVFNNLCAIYLDEREDILYKLDVASLCSVAAMFAMMVAFMTGSYAVLAITNRIAITICVFSSFFFIFVFGSVWTIWIKKRRVRHIQKTLRELSIHLKSQVSEN